MKTETKKIKVRGTATIDPADNTFKFAPFNEAPSTQADVKTCGGGGKRWKTNGSDPLVMLTLKCKSSSADQYAELYKQFAALTKDLHAKQPVKLPQEMRVMAEKGVECWIDGKNGKLTFAGNIDIARHCRDWQAELLRLVQLMVRTLPGNEKFKKIITKEKSKKGALK